jgi:hypothetical protein
VCEGGLVLRAARGNPAVGTVVDLTNGAVGRGGVAVPEKTVAQKARVKPGARIALVNRVSGIVESLGLPRSVGFVGPAEADLVFLFARTRAELDAKLPAAVAALAPTAAIWVFFRKGSRQAGLDMNRDTVWAVAEKLGLRPLGLVGVDDTWSAFRLRPGRR